MSLTILFHGTGDTQYKDDMAYLVANQLEPIGKGAHTLSFFADCIAEQAEQIAEPLFSHVTYAKVDPYLLKIRNEVVIIQGADDTGTEVHNLIVSGLMAALNGIMRGEKEINFIGFSRGSVEAIHMTHELQRIKDYVNHPGNDLSTSALYSFICDKCYNPGRGLGAWRSNRIKKHYQDALLATLGNELHLQKLIEGLRSPDLKLNGKLLDPVPGLCEGTKIPTYIPWTALAHHTVIAPMVNEVDIAYMDSEFSVGFRAVWVEAAPESTTQVNRYHLPGAHSTANGNPVNHNPAQALATDQRFPFEKLRCVQKLFFYKLLQFAFRHNIPLKPPEGVAGRYLSPVFEHFMAHQFDITAQNEFLRAQYKEMAVNLAEIRTTRRTCYIPEWLNILGLGGTEQLNGTRIIMTKAGPRSMADLHNYDINGASSYVNFESFSLDFMTLLFPELSTPPTESPNRPMSYNGLEHVVRARYASASPEMDCAALTNKIKALLKACLSHQLEDDLNRILLQDTLDHQGIFDQLIELVPPKLANSFYSSNLTQTDREMLQEAIDVILRFEMSELGAEEQSETHRALLRKKQAYIKKFQANMQKEIAEQTHTFLANLLEAAEQFQCRASQPILGTELSEQAPVFDTMEYLAQADQYYRALITLQDKMSFSSTYLAPIDRERLQYKIDEAVAQFPAICERTLRKHTIDISQAQILEFRVMQPLKERLNYEAALRDNLERTTQRIGALESDLDIRTQRIRVLESDLEIRTQRIRVLEGELKSSAQRIEEQESDLDSRARRIVALESDLESNAETIGVLEGELKSSAQRFGVLEGELDSKTQRIGVLEGELDSRAQRIGTLEGKLQSRTQRIGVLECDFDIITQRIGVLEGELDSKTQRIGVLETEKETEAERLSNTKLTVDRHTTEHTAQIRQHEAANMQSQNDIERLHNSLQGIRDTLRSHQQNGHYSGFTVTLLGSLSLILGVIIAAIATHFLLLGTGGLMIPAAGLGLGAGLTLFGMSALKTGAQRQREEQLSNIFFPG